MTLRGLGFLPQPKASANSTKTACNTIGPLTNRTYAPEHSRFRRLLSNSFSEKGMRDIQPWIQTLTELLLKRLRDHSEAGGYTHISEWYNWATFDMIGDLAFGESSHCLEYKQTDPWIASLFDCIKIMSLVSTIKRYGLESLPPYLASKNLLHPAR